MVLDVGDEPRLGSVMKLTGNFFIVSFIEIVAEGGAWPACALRAARPLGFRVNPQPSTLKP